jgi:hypothetical protein
MARGEREHVADARCLAPLVVGERAAEARQTPAARAATTKARAFARSVPSCMTSDGTK